MLRNYAEQPGKCFLLIEIARLRVLREISWHSGFSFAADRHFCFSPYHFQLLPRLFTERFRQKQRRPRATSLLIIRPTKETFTSRTKMLSLHTTNQASQANLHRQVHVHAGIPCKSDHYMHACIITSEKFQPRGSSSVTKLLCDW